MSLLRAFASHCRSKLHQRTRLGACNYNRSTTRFDGSATFEPRKFLSMNPNAGAKNDKERSAPRQRHEHGRRPFVTWVRLAIGSVLAIFAPFLNSKWKALLQIGSEVEMAKDVAETVAEVVEQVATVAENASSEVAERLPEDGKLKQAAVFVEHASKEVAEEAHLAKDIIHKVGEIEKEMKIMLAPIVEHGNHGNGDGHSKNRP